MKNFEFKQNKWRTGTQAGVFFHTMTIQTEKSPLITFIYGPW